MMIIACDNRWTSARDGTTLASAFPPPFTAIADMMAQIQAADGTIPP